MWIRIDKALSIPPDVRLVLGIMSDAGFEAFLVGGCVRDSLRGVVHTRDFDVATNAKPSDIQGMFPKAIEVGKAFGVFKLMTPSGQDIEIATFRKEGEYRDHRHPSKVEFTDVASDSARRDFTINALYYDPRTTQVLDLHGGLADLQQKVIRAIGNPEKRLNEDSLRLLRAVRFAARFEFTIEEQTRAALLKLSPLIRKISIERVRDELEKMITHASCRAAMIELDAVGLLENVLPEISVGKLNQKKVWDQTLRVLTNLGQYRSIEPSSFYWGALFLPTLRLHPIEKRDQEARKLGSRLKLSNDVIEQMAYLVRETPKFKDAFSMRESTLMRWMREPNFELLMRFHELDAFTYDGNSAGLEFVKSIYTEAKRKFQNKPLLTGDDLVKLGMNPGRQFTEILREVEDQAYEGKLTTNQEALDYVLKHFVK